MLGNLIHSIDDFFFLFRDTLFLSYIFYTLFNKRYSRRSPLHYAVSAVVWGLFFRGLYTFLSGYLENQASIRQTNDVLPFQSLSLIRPILLLTYALFIGAVLTPSHFHYRLELALFYIPASDMLQVLSYQISRQWPESLLSNWNMVYVLRAITTTLFLMLLTYLLIAFGKRLLHNTNTWFHAVTLAASVLLCVLSMYIAQFADSIFILSIIYSLFIVITVLICLFLGEVFQNHENRQRALFQQEIENDYRNYVFELEELSAQMRLFRHEFQGKLLLLSTLLEEKKYAVLKEQLQEMLQSIPSSEQLVSTGNHDFDAIINRKLSEIKAQGIALQVHVCIPPTLPCSTEDFFSLANNIMNNALEAASKSSNPKIFFSASTAKNYFILNVKNSCNGDVLLDNPTLSTTKSNAKYHGFGVSLIRQLAEKYNGMVDFSTSPNFFQCKLLLPMISEIYAPKNNDPSAG